jgi:hypothetical protein
MPNEVTKPFLNRHIPSQGDQPYQFYPTNLPHVLDHLEDLGLMDLAHFEYTAAGKSGEAFRVTGAGPDFHHQLFENLAATIETPNGSPQSVVVKIINLEEQIDANSAERECKVQQWVHGQSTVVSGTRLNGKDVVSSLFYAGIGEGESTGWFYIVVMSEAPGVTLDGLLKEQSWLLSAAQYVLLEKALATLWALGIAHNDPHVRNTFLDTTSCKVTVIDYGFALVIPEEIHKCLLRFPFGTKDAGDAWDQRCGGAGIALLNYTNAIQRGRGYGWYNPDTKSIKFYRTLVKDPRNIPQARKRLWRTSTKKVVRHRAVSGQCACVTRKRIRCLRRAQARKRLCGQHSKKCMSERKWQT